jgi:hypothetical protein
MKRITLVILLISVVFLSGCISQSGEKTKYVCPDGSVVSDVSKCPKTTTTSTTLPFSVNNIEVENDNFDVDLWLNAEGGPASVHRTVTIRNRNNVDIKVQVGCFIFYDFYNIGCRPEWGSHVEDEFLINSNDMKTVTFNLYSSVLPVESPVGTKSSLITVRLLEADGKTYNTDIKNIPVEITVHGRGS